MRKCTWSVGLMSLLAVILSLPASAAWARGGGGGGHGGGGHGGGHGGHSHGGHSHGWGRSGGWSRGGAYGGRYYAGGTHSGTMHSFSSPMNHGSPSDHALANGMHHSPGMMHHHHPHGYWNNQSNFFGFGSPFFGYLQYPWLGLGYGNNGYGYYPWGGSGNCYTYPYGGVYQPTLAYNGLASQAAVAPASTNGAGGAPAADQLASSIDFAGQGELDFRAGQYALAVQDWRHALVDDPRNGAIVLLLSQALFQTGQYDEAAGAAQQALRMLPQDKWGAVVGNYRQLYGNSQHYTDQLKALERARDAKPSEPGLRFLLGYHFGFLGYPKEAVRELSRGLDAAPQDEVAVKLRDQFQARLNDGTSTSHAATKPVEETRRERTGLTGT